MLKGGMSKLLALVILGIMVIQIIKPLGLIEICRTGIAAMNRGSQGM